MQLQLQLKYNTITTTKFYNTMLKEITTIHIHFLLLYYTILNTIQPDPIPIIQYPYQRSLDPKTHAPSSVPQEMTLLERWLGLLPPRAALVDAHNNIYDTYNLIDHAYDATQFVSYGLDNIIRGMAQTQIPDFKSGVQGLLRHMDFNLMYVRYMLLIVNNFINIFFQQLYTHVYVYMFI